MREYAPQVRVLALVWLGAFAILALAAGYWQVIAAPSLQAHPENARAAARLSLTQPGSIYSADGALLLGAEREETGWRRTYPEPETFCHLTGYNERTGLQWGMREALYALGRYADPWQSITRGRMRGLDVHLTIDASAQRVAAEAMRGKRGAVVALDPRDGAIKVLFSAPTYNPQVVLHPAEFEVFRTDPQAPGYNRPLQGLYTPGSALKVMTAATALDTGAVSLDSSFQCAGETRIAGSRVACPRAHGRVTFTEALAQSCNIAFALMGQEIGAGRFRDHVKGFALLDAADPGVGLPSNSGRMADLLGPKGDVFLAHTAYGQGQVSVTPLAMARLAATLAGGGRVVQPYLVQQITTSGGRTVAAGQARELGQAVSREAAREVAGMMVEAVERGTAGVMRLRGVKVAAKTGTGQKDRGKPDVWMLAFAPAEDPVVVIAVVVEAGESGGETAGPVAVEVLRALLGG